MLYPQRVSHMSRTGRSRGGRCLSRAEQTKASRCQAPCDIYIYIYLFLQKEMGTTNCFPKTARTCVRSRSGHEIEPLRPERLRATQKCFLYTLKLQRSLRRHFWIWVPVRSLVFGASDFINCCRVTERSDPEVTQTLDKVWLCFPSGYCRLNDAFSSSKSSANVTKGLKQRWSKLLSESYLTIMKS